MDYQSMKLPELKALAKERSIAVTGLKKQEVIEQLTSYDETHAKPKQIRREQTQESHRSQSAGAKTDMHRSQSRGTYTKAASNRDKREQSGYHVRTVEFQAAHRLPGTEDKKEGVEDTAVGYHAKPAESSQAETPARRNEPIRTDGTDPLDSGETAHGILEVIADGYGFIRSDNYLSGDNDIYVSVSHIKNHGLKTGDIITGALRVKQNNGQKEKFRALLYVKEVNGFPVEQIKNRVPFEKLTPIFPNERINLENAHSHTIPMRIMDLIAPIGKGQRGMIVSQPKTGKTTLLKQVAISISRNYPDMHLIVLLIDERPEEVTDIRESIAGDNVEVIYSTFDELPDNHKRVSEMVLERAKRLVEQKQDVVILLDSITRLARAYNLTVPPSGRTLTGGLDPAALHMPKKFFGAARNMREGGSLTILATALVETGSKMDDVVFEEFKGTGNMELVLDRKLSEKRIFPAFSLAKSSTRRDDLLLTKEEQEAVYAIRKELAGQKSEEATEEILKLFLRTKDNAEFVKLIHSSLIARKN